MMAQHKITSMLFFINWHLQSMIRDNNNFLNKIHLDEILSTHLVLTLTFYLVVTWRDQTVKSELMIWKSHTVSHSWPGRQKVCSQSRCYKPASGGEMKLLLETGIMAQVHQNTGRPRSKEHDGDGEISTWLWSKKSYQKKWKQFT